MDYNSMKKLASAMGEEFKMIDSLTLENINLQRLITKEKEYCANLEALLKQSDNDIESVENETRRLKSKLEEVKNSGLLLKTSLESLKSSHKMVDLLKIDLQKQLHLEEIRSSEQSMKFNSTIEKYEVMWESYKSTYQKFPLVDDLHKSELKLKQKSIQLAIQERSIKSYKEKIKAFCEILDKREIVTIVNIAEKYLRRRKLIQEKNTLEENIRLKEESIKIVKDNEKRGKPLGILNVDTKREFFRKPRPFIIDSLEESNKENVYLRTDASTSTQSKALFQRYEAVLAKRYQSVPLLKLPPLPLLDSPPRKVRSVGNLFSPPKTEWFKEDVDGHTVKNTYETDENQCNPSATDISSNEQNSWKAEKEVVQIGVMEAENLNPKISSDVSADTAENQMVSDDLECEKKCDMNISEMEANSREKEMENMEVDEESESIEKTSKFEDLPKDYNNELKTIPPLNSVEFSYEPRTDIKFPKILKMSAEGLKSPYFVPNYLNFLEIPKSVEEATEKANKPQENNLITDSNKNKPVIIDLTDEEGEKVNERKENLKCNRQEVHAEGDEVSEISRLRTKEQDSVQPLAMDMDNENVPHNDTYTIHDAQNKQYEGADEEVNLTQNSSMYQSISNEDQSYRFDGSLEKQNHSFDSQMEFSQVSYADSVEYAGMPYSPSMVQSPRPPSPNINNEGNMNLFGSPPGQSFNYKFSQLPQTSASALFGDSTSTNNEGKERKQTEVFNFSFDQKRNTSTMFKLF